MIDATFETRDEEDMKDILKAMDSLANGRNLSFIKIELELLKGD